MMELSRQIPFGQFVNNGSRLVRLDPRVKIICLALLVGVLVSVRSWVAFLILFGCCFLIQAASRLRFSFVLRGFRPLLLLLPMMLFFQIFFYQPSSGVQNIWQWGIFSLSWEGINVSLQLTFRVFILYYFTTMFLFVISLVDLTDGLEGVLMPLRKLHLPVHVLVIVLVIAFRFVPIFVKEFEQLIKAQTARGVRFDRGNFFRKAMRYGRLLLPLFVRGFKKAEALSVAMEARCYGLLPSWQRGKRRTFHLQRSDYITCLLVLMICAFALLSAFFLPS